MLSRLSLGAVMIATCALASACSSSEPAASSGRDAAPPAAANADPSPAPTPTHGHAGEGLVTTGSVATKVRYEGPLPPLPTPGFMPPRPPDVVLATYEFAGRRPDVMQYIPCFCACERSGHVGNDDCFVSGRDADGKPRWDLHGMG